MTLHASAHESVLPVDGILIINPRNFIERRENIERQLRSLGLTYEFIHTYDASDLDAATVHRHFTVPYPNLGNQSCAMKHLAALRLVVKRQWRRALILEDDVILAPDFVQGVCDAITESSAIRHPYVLYIGSGGNFYTPQSMRGARTTVVQGFQGAIYGFLYPGGRYRKASSGMDGAAWDSRSDRLSLRCQRSQVGHRVVLA